MDVLKFYDCAKDGNMPTSKYQLDLCLSNYGFMDLVINDRAYRVSEIEKTEHILMYRLNELKTTSEINAFLDYHFGLCQENKNDFLDDTKYLINMSLELNNTEHEYVKERINGIDIKGKPYKITIIDKLKADVCFDWIEKQKKLLNHNNNSESTKYFPFDNRELNIYINPNKLEAFNNIERALFDSNMLDSNGKWNTLKPRLVALIYILNRLGYTNEIIKGKTKSNTNNHIKQFFQKRYLIDISQEFKPSKFDVKKLHNYHPDFLNIIPDIDLIKK